MQECRKRVPKRTSTSGCHALSYGRFTRVVSRVLVYFSNAAVGHASEVGLACSGWSIQPLSKRPVWVPAPVQVQIEESAIKMQASESPSDCQANSPCHHPTITRTMKRRRNQRCRSSAARGQRAKSSSCCSRPGKTKWHGLTI